MTRIGGFIGDQSVIELGTRSFTMSDSPVLMVSNRYNETFRAANHTRSKGVYCAYKPEELDLFETSIAQFI